MKFFIEPEISCSRWFGQACFNDDGELTEMGEFINSHLQNGLFIDVPCGLAVAPDPTKDFAMAPLVKALGAAEYWEVDVDATVLDNRIVDGGNIGQREEDGLPIVTMQSDILSFISQIEPTNIDVPKIIYISALQPDIKNCEDVAAPYLTALYDELTRVTAKDDLVILNSGDMLVTGLEETHPFIHPALTLPAKGLQLRRRCAYDKVQVFSR